MVFTWAYRQSSHFFKDPGATTVRSKSPFVRAPDYFIFEKANEALQCVLPE